MSSTMVMSGETTAGTSGRFADFLVATVSAPQQLDALPACVSWLEYRADTLGDGHVHRLAFTTRQSIYVLRSRESGGHAAILHPARAGRLIRAADHHELIELDASLDLEPFILDAIPPDRRVIAWYGEADSTEQLTARFHAMASISARLYRIVSRARHPSDSVLPMLLTRREMREDLIAYASGASGVWTRILGVDLGNAMAFSGTAVDGRHDDPGGLSIARMVSDYPSNPRATRDRIFGIVGTTIRYSLSPMLHNQMYRACAIPSIYLPFTAGARQRSLDWFVEFAQRIHDALGVCIDGVTVMAPYKEAALDLVGPTKCSALATEVGAANILTRRDGQWYADTTDVYGILEPIRACKSQLSGLRVDVIGCGGAGRAAAVGLRNLGADVMLINRSRERGRWASRLLDIPYASLDRFKPGSADIVINATPVGRLDDCVPFDVSSLPPDVLVVDLVYRADSHTPLIAQARQRGLATVDGRDVLEAEVRKQFELMTGRPAPDLDIQALLSGPARV